MEEFAEKTRKTIKDIRSDEREFSDWTQMSLSIQDAVACVAANFALMNYGEYIRAMNGFIQDLCRHSVGNIMKYDIITYKKEQQ